MQRAPEDLHRHCLQQLPGHAADLSACTFALEEEDHTMGNVIRYSKPK